MLSAATMPAPRLKVLFREVPGTPPAARRAGTLPLLDTLPVLGSGGEPTWQDTDELPSSVRRVRRGDVLLALPLTGAAPRCARADRDGATLPAVLVLTPTHTPAAWRGLDPASVHWPAAAALCALAARDRHPAGAPSRRDILEQTPPDAETVAAVLTAVIQTTALLENAELLVQTLQERRNAVIRGALADMRVR